MRDYIADIKIRNGNTYEVEFELNDFEAERAVSKATVFLKTHQDKNLMKRFVDYLKKDFEELENVLK